MAKNGIINKQGVSSIQNSRVVRYVQRNGNNLFECEKVFQKIHIVLPTEQSIKSSTFIFQTFCLNFRSNFTVLKELMNEFWNDFQRLHTMAASAHMFYIAIGYKNKAASNINIAVI